jgi:ATP-dependent Clp protease ATP-binding subunit ClpC
MNNFTPEAQEALQKAREEADRFNHGYIGTEHLLAGIALLGDRGPLAPLLAEGLSIDALRLAIEQQVGSGGAMKLAGNLPYTPRLKKVLALAANAARAAREEYVGPEHMLLGLLREGNGVAVRILMNLDVDTEALRRHLSRSMRPEGTQDPSDDMEGDGSGDASDGAPSGRQQPDPTPALTAFGRDITELARKGELDPVVGRADEIERVMRILCRRTKNNPVLLGEAGVGKTAVVEGLAQAIANDEVPELLRGKRLVSLDLALMVAGTKYRGQFEERIKAVMEEIRRVKNVILFVDELHSLVGAGGAEGAMDAANILKPALARGEIQIVGATTLNEYRRFVEKDAALERRFQSVLVREPSQEEALEILKGLCARYEDHHHVKYRPDALEAAVTLSARYLQDRFLPDKAIDVIDEAGARARIASMTRPPALKEQEQTIRRLKEERDEAVKKEAFEEAARLRDEEKALRASVEETLAKWRKEEGEKIVEVTEEDVRLIVSKWTGVPLKKMEKAERAKLLEMETVLKSAVIGQDDAIGSICRALRRSRADLKDPRRPIGSFIFLGPTGVGKTLLAKSLAEFMFNSPDALIQIDMSEYMEKFNASRLVGSPPGYVGYEEGGQLTERVRRRPYSVVLFDEIEKAHPDVMHMLLQILEEGRLTDGLGRAVDFRNTIIIMTSNVGSDAGKRGAGLGFSGTSETEDYAKLRDRTLEAARTAFRPELLNRVEEVIVFRTLQKDDVRRILDIELSKVAARLKSRGIRLDLQPEATEFLLAKGWDRRYGARPLRRAVERYIENVLAEDILRGAVTENEILQVVPEGDHLAFRPPQGEAPDSPPAPDPSPIS